MKKNEIIGEIIITEKDINKDIRIINSYEEANRNCCHLKKREYGNEKEIKDNIEIIINNEKIDFSYFYKFKEKGKHLIKYVFKNKLSNISYMFAGCTSLSNINLSNFNTQNVTNMFRMFSGCKSLKKENILTKDKNLIKEFMDNH